ncbi:type VI secretion protein [Streptomyces sp. NPDC054766]
MSQYPDRHDDRHAPRPEGAGGIPDGLLIGVLGFLLGMTLMVWSATGLAGWFSRGAWPDAITFTRTPLAMRHLIGAPHDIPGAWPDTPAAQLSGYGLFWGLFIGQLMVLLVLAVFVMGAVARWRAGRARRRSKTAATAASTDVRDPVVPTARTEQQPLPAPMPAQPLETARRAAEDERAGAQTRERRGEQAHEPVRGHAGSQARDHAGARDTVSFEATPSRAATAPLPKPTWTSTRAVVLAPMETRHPTAAQAVRDAEGPALVITSDPRTWSETKDARAKLGPVLLYDPAHLCDTPARLHWSPVGGCEDKETAAARATALLAPIRPSAKADQAMADVAETLMRSYLHAAAVEGKTFRHVHRWAQGSQVQDAVRALRTNPKAASGAAGELEAALISHPERRDIAQELTARALSSFGTVNIRESCAPNRNDSLALDSFVNEGGTLYLVGEPIEDPRANPGAMPLLTALASSVVERGRRMAERSSSGRLDPPLTLVLDDIAAVAPLPQLPDLLTTGPARGLPTLALLRSREQLRSRWPQYELPV